MGEPTTPDRTPGGKTLTGADIEALAAEAERGYDIEALKARRQDRPLT
ncbi:MAG TPA: hypothetical protein VGC79_12925 [Polyangiaceae bacterium]